MQKNAGGWGTTLTLYINAPVVHCQLPLQSKTKNKQKKTDTHTHAQKKDQTTTTNICCRQHSVLVMVKKVKNKRENLIT